MELLKTRPDFNPVEDEEKMAYELLQKILLNAFADRASDVHFEPLAGEAVVKFRVDGSLQEISRHSNKLIDTLIRVVKKMSRLNPDETSMPQDGRIITLDDDDERIKKYDLRISTFPTIHGERMVFRVLNAEKIKETLTGGLEIVGFEGEDLEAMEGILKSPYGLVIFSGPSGSGKTTTAYQSLAHLVNRTKGKCLIFSLEDPVEVFLDGVVQVRVDPGGDFDYARALKALLRQDLDVVFISDIPDQETARMVMEVAMTGHLALVQVNAIDCAHAIYRFIGLGLEPYLLSTVFEGVTSQRLARRICPDCKKSAKVPVETVRSLLQGRRGIPDSVDFKKGEGCPSCRGTGYIGRTAIYEIAPRSEHLVNVIAKGPKVEELRNAIRGLQHPTLRDNAVKKAVDGVITLEEGVRVTAGLYSP